MKRFLIVALLLVAAGAAVAAFLSRPVRVPEASGTWEPAEHEPATN
jgi:hypothetical protein